MSHAADVRLALTIRKHAPTYLNNWRARGIFKAILEDFWPAPFLGLAAFFAGKLPTGYPHPNWPFFIAVVVMVWWKGRPAGAGMIGAVLIYYVAIGMPPGRLAANGVTLLAFLILRGRYGLKT